MCRNRHPYTSLQPKMTYWVNNHKAYSQNDVQHKPQKEIYQLSKQLSLMLKRSKICSRPVHEWNQHWNCVWYVRISAVDNEMCISVVFAKLHIFPHCSLVGLHHASIINSPLNLNLFWLVWLKLFWIDAKLDVIGSMNLDGSDRVILVRIGDKHPFGITVSEVSQLFIHVKIVTYKTGCMLIGANQYMSQTVQHFLEFCITSASRISCCNEKHNFRQNCIYGYDELSLLHSVFFRIIFTGRIGALMLYFLSAGQISVKSKWWEVWRMTRWVLLCGLRNRYVSDFSLITNASLLDARHKYICKWFRKF